MPKFVQNTALQLNIIPAITIRESKNAAMTTMDQTALFIVALTITQQNIYATKFQGRKNAFYDYYGQNCTTYCSTYNNTAKYICNQISGSSKHSFSPEIWLHIYFAVLL